MPNWNIANFFLKHHSNHKEHNWKEKGKIFKRKTYQWRLRTPSWTQSLKHVVLYKWADTWPFRKADFFTKIFFCYTWVSFSYPNSKIISNYPHNQHENIEKLADFSPSFERRTGKAWFLKNITCSTTKYIFILCGM